MYTTINNGIFFISLYRKNNILVPPGCTKTQGDKPNFKLLFKINLELN